MSVQNFLLKKFLRHYYKPKFTPELTLEMARNELDTIINEFMPSPCTSLDVSSKIFGGIDCEIISQKSRESQGTFLYIHGGAFAMGSALSHRGVTCEIAKEQLFDMVVPNYKLAPESPYPAAINDLLQVWWELINDESTIKPIILGGDQAGACLAMQLLLELQSQHQQLPDAFVGISGLYDLTLSSPSMVTNKEADCVNRINVFERGINYYLPEELSVSAADVSPLYSPLQNLPPVLLQAADNELLVDDSRRLAQQIEAKGGTVVLDVWEDVPSCWHIGAIALPEGRSAIKKIAQFVNQYCR